MASRFDGQFRKFVKTLKSYGFEKVRSEQTEDTYFVRVCMRKVFDCQTTPKAKLPSFKLNPCTYKKR